MTVTLDSSQRQLFAGAREDDPAKDIHPRPADPADPESANHHPTGTACNDPDEASYNENGYVEVDPAGFVDSYRPPAIDGDFRGKHIVTVEQFGREDLKVLFEAAATLKKRIRSGDRGVVEIATGQVLALLFFEASTRTDMSFQAAMLRLGGKVIGASNGIRFSSVYKGEDLPDTVRAAGCYADVISLRHPQVGASYMAAHYLDLLAEKIGRWPVVISAGDGVGEHPTQALLDLFTILESKGTVDGLAITMVGDLKHGRTVHSLAKLLATYGARETKVNFVSPPSLIMPDSIVERLREADICVSKTSDLEEVLGRSDVIYWTRVQEERFVDQSDYEEVKEGFIMTPGVMGRARPDAILMHPLPRKHEMGGPADHELLDADPRSVYFQQMENGMLVRMALLAKLLRGVHV
ncbi:MAG: aspartate carbamoyltransferase [bacterium]|nr:aspartate carbamoyltransferase [bacterium]